MTPIRQKLDVRLVEMPPKSLKWPSLGLTQLKAVTKLNFKPEEVSVQIHYLNYSFAEYVGFEEFNTFTTSRVAKGHTFFEWFFRQVAFPDLPDNQVEYFRSEGLELIHMFNPAELAENRRKIQYANQLIPLMWGLEETLKRWIRDFGLDQADIVGFSSMFSQNIPILAMARLLKELNPSLTILMGGSNCETPMGEELVRNFEVLDYVFSGPSLKSFPKFLTHFIEHSTEGLKH